MDESESTKTQTRPEETAEADHQTQRVHAHTFLHQRMNIIDSMLHLYDVLLKQLCTVSTFVLCVMMDL